VSRLLRLSLGAALVTAGCAPTEPQPSASAPIGTSRAALTVTTRTSTVLEGSALYEAGLVAFRSELLSPTHAVAAVDLAGKKITMSADGNSGKGGVVRFQVDGGGWRGPEDVEMLERLAADLETIIPWPAAFGDPDSANAAEGLLRAYVSFLASARHAVSADPYEFAMGDIDIEVSDDFSRSSGSTASARSGPSLGGGEVSPNFAPGFCGGAPVGGPGACNCVDDEDPGNRVAVAVQFISACCSAPFGRARGAFSDGVLANCNGATSSAVCGFGSIPGCRGRCGFQCFAPGAYTQDCFDHDVCSGTTFPAGGIWWSSPDCGDEFWEAASDTALVYSVWFAVAMHRVAFFPAALLGCF
jgi:hypothetical protein